LFLLAGIIALTQESEDFNPGSPQTGEEAQEEVSEEDESETDNPPDNALTEETGEAPPRETPEWVKPARWFRSNTAGMPLEEIPSRLAALRNEYALVIDFTEPDELPEHLIPYYDDGYFIENRAIYKEGEKLRTQWIFRDINGTTRLLAVFPDAEDESINGFIEVYGKDYALQSEYKFADGKCAKTEFSYNKGVMVSATEWQWDEGAPASPESALDGKYKKMYTDYFRYNRSKYLRNVERVYHEEQLIKTYGDSLAAVFPVRIMDAARDDAFFNEKLNAIPDFFGETAVNEGDRIVFATDERGRVTSETLFDKDDNVIWEIKNSWAEDRVVSIRRTEGETELLVEYEYDEEGNRIVERNLRDGVLERVVRTEDKFDYEELYLQGRVFLTAVWEDGRKISETRVRSN
jgi:YD repeat-containing protein